MRLFLTHHALAEAARDEAAKLVVMVCPQRPGESIKSLIVRTSMTLGWSYSRTEDIWRKEARTINSWEMDMLRRVAGKRLSRKTASER